MLIRDTEAISEILGSDTPEKWSMSKDLFSANLIVPPKLHETFRLDPADGLSLPNVIIPASGDTEDFFATVATYYQDQSPLSAMVYVLSQETATLITKRAKESKKRATSQSRRFRLACLGAAIGETTLAGLGTNEIGRALSYASCRRSLAFSLCRTTYIHESTLRADALASRWTKLRKLTGLSVSKESTASVLLVHDIALGKSVTSSLPRIDTPLSKMLQEYADGNDSDGSMLMLTLVRLYPMTKAYVDNMRDAFDNRMTAFTQLVKSIQISSRGTRIDEIAVAFFCNLILPGSFAHTGVLAKLVDFFPASLVWYGFFAALSQPSASQRLNPNLIAKLERDLLDTFSFEQRPRCDISLEELEVLSRGSLRAESVQPSQQRALLVALVPGVDVYTRFGSEGGSINERSHRDTETDELHTRVSKLLEEALLTLNKTGMQSKEWRKNR